MPVRGHHLLLTQGFLALLGDYGSWTGVQPRWLGPFPPGIWVQEGFLGYLEATESSHSAGASLPCQLTPLRRAQKQWLFFLRE